MFPFARFPFWDDWDRDVAEAIAFEDSLPQWRQWEHSLAACWASPRQQPHLLNPLFLTLELSGTLDSFLRLRELVSVAISGPAGCSRLGVSLRSQYTDREIREDAETEWRDYCDPEEPKGPYG